MVVEYNSTIYKPTKADNDPRTFQDRSLSPLKASSSAFEQTVVESDAHFSAFLTCPDTTQTLGRPGNLAPDSQQVMLPQGDHKVESVLNFYHPSRSTLAWRGKSRNVVEAAGDVGVHGTSAMHMTTPTYDPILSPRL